MSSISHTVNNTFPTRFNVYSCNTCGLKFTICVDMQIHEETCIAPKQLWSDFFMYQGYLYHKSSFMNDDIHVPSPLMLNKYITPTFSLLEKIKIVKKMNVTVETFNPVTPMKKVSIDRSRMWKSLLIIAEHEYKKTVHS